MSQQITKALMCVQLRSGVEIWVESDRADNLQAALEKITQSKFILFEGETFNTADIVGVFRASTMESATRRKNGQTQCKEGTWHDKNEKCECIPQKQKELIEKRNAAIAACGKCVSGYRLQADGVAAPCDCLAGL